jgi:predicted dehydrogenase
VNGSAELRAAVIGVGSFGRHHARILHDLRSEGVRLVGLVDVDLEGPRDIAERYAVPLVSHVDALPEPVDVVSIAVPTADHRRVAEPLLERGVHCLVEKPIAGSRSDAEALVAAARKGRAVLEVGLVERFNPVRSALDRLGAAPAFLEIHRLAPFTRRSTDVGVVMDLMIHDLDLVSHLVGEDAERIDAVGVPVFGPHEDLANARITFPSGCVANLTASRVSLQRMRRFRIFSREGYLSLDYDHQKALLVRPPSEPPSASGLTGLAMEELPIRDAEPLREELVALVRAVREGRGPGAGWEDALRALGLAEGILAALRAHPVPRGP